MQLSLRKWGMLSFQLKKSCLKNLNIQLNLQYQILELEYQEINRLIYLMNLHKQMKIPRGNLGVQVLVCQ